MGGVCSSAEDPNMVEYGEFKVQLSLPRLIRLQAAVRTFLAKRTLITERERRLKAIMSKCVSPNLTKPYLCRECSHRYHST